MYESRFAWLQREQSFKGNCCCWRERTVIGVKELHTYKESQLAQQYIIMEADRKDRVMDRVIHKVP
jgi:hypothetical protein